MWYSVYTVDVALDVTFRSVLLLIPQTEARGGDVPPVSTWRSERPTPTPASVVRTRLKNILTLQERGIGH